MKFSIDRTDRLAAARIIVIYVLFAALWIYLSDTALDIFVQDRAMLVRLSVYKGLLFILVTSILLYQLVIRHIRRTRGVEKELLSSRIFINSLLEGTTDAIFVKDHEGRYLLINTATANYIGRPSKEIIGKNDTEIFNADEGNAIMAGDQRVMNGEKVLTYEDYLTTSDGVYRTFLSTKGPIYDGTGKVCGIFGIARDITGLKITEKELASKKEEMERFTYMVSHDLKSPLVTIKTFLGYLGQDLARERMERVSEDMRFIGAAADKMGELLEELLEMSRIGRITNPPVRATFRELVDEALRLVAGPISRSGVEIRIGDGDIIMLGDRPRLVTIWQNLVENAVKFMGGQNYPFVEIGFEGAGPGALFFVRDNGMGIDPGNADNIFGFCSKIDPASDGTGLGLAMTKRIVEFYGGKIEMESEGLGHGACFRFTLPEAVTSA